MSRAVLFVIFILFFIALFWQNWIFGLTDQVAAACPAHPTCTFFFTFYLQFSKALNFSSSWPSSSVSLREWCHFWQICNWTSLSTMAVLCLAWVPGDEFPTLHGSLVCLYLQQKQRNACKAEPLLRVHVDPQCLGYPLSILFLCWRNHILWFVAQILFVGDLFD